MRKLWKVSKNILSSVIILFLLSFNTTDIKTKASWYGTHHQGKRTASGELFNKNDYTAAHKTLKFGTKIKVTNLKNGKEVIVRINDRGPMSKCRDLDLSEAAFKQISNLQRGVIKIEYEIL